MTLPALEELEVWGDKFTVDDDGVKATAAAVGRRVAVVLRNKDEGRVPEWEAHEPSGGVVLAEDDRWRGRGGRVRGPSLEWDANCFAGGPSLAYERAGR